MYNILKHVSAWMLFVLMVLGSADVIGRYIFNSPIQGVMEISEILLAGMVFLGWPYTQAVKAHITVELLTSHFPPRGQAIANIIHPIAGLVLFALVMWQAIQQTIVYWKSNTLIDVIMVPLAPFHIFVSVGAFFLCLVFIVQILQSFSEMRKGG